STENMLNSEFRKLEESVDKALSLNRQKIRDAISEHTTSVKQQLDTLSTTVSTQLSTTEAELSRQAEKPALAGDQRAGTVSGADRAQRHGRHFPGVLG
ncbi:MbeB family mobilization protein, partial [Escherichia coli]|uniref:MbeB family mobilization protein n=1 Tax=Escherichia coli TaxID=562 RepID=UPI00207D13E0